MHLDLLLIVRSRPEILVEKAGTCHGDWWPVILFAIFRRNFFFARKIYLQYN
jgi:hypothetical protein